MKIIGIGETVLDLLFKNSQPVAAVPGGSTFNAMVSLGRTAARQFEDLKLLVVTQMGDDQVGGIMSDFMKKNSLSTDAVIFNKGHQSTLSMAFLDSNNDAHYEFYRDSLPSERTLLQEYDANGRIQFCKNDIVLFGSFFAVESDKRELVKSILKDARDAGAIIYYDINFRKRHKGTLEQLRATVEENMAMCDFVRGSLEDINNLYFPESAPGQINTKEVYHNIISRFCRNFICTKGPNPVDLFSGDIHETVSVPRVNTVSTIGAGDNFNAGFIYGLVRYGVDKERSADMTSELWAETAGCAKKFSAAVCCSINNYVDEDFLETALLTPADTL